MKLEVKPRRVANLAEYLPALLTIKNKPMSLDDYFVFRPVFSTNVPQRVTLRAGRQLGKTRQIAARLIVQAAVIPGSEIIVVTPLQEQSDRLSSVIFRPMLTDSPVRLMLRDDDRVGSIRRRDFTNRSIIHFTYAGQDTDRVRSLSGNILWPDEAQDVDPANLPVLFECLGAAPEPILFMSGTSKTKDTTLELAWYESSQGIWQIVCDACGFDNVCAVEGGHLLSMIGPVRDDISEEAPGTLCHRCKRPVSPRRGRWVHRFPERLREHVGLYVPQPIMPRHYASPLKWGQLVAKMNGLGNYTQAKFMQEVVGEAFDSAYKLVSVDDLKAAGRGVGPNDPRHAAARARAYRMVVLGVDWGGGGADGVSRTKVAAAGICPDGSAEVFYGRQYPPSTDRVAEGRDILEAARLVGAHLIAHDVQGAGAPSESVVNHLGWPLERLVGVAYRQSVGGRMLEYHKPAGGRFRGFYSADKAHALQFVAMAIRAGRVRFFDYDWKGTNDPGLLHDWLALVECETETPTGKAFRVIRSAAAGSDDFAHACAYGLMALWEYNVAWPDLSVVGRVGPQPD